MGGCWLRYQSPTHLSLEKGMDIRCSVLCAQAFCGSSLLIKFLISLLVCAEPNQASTNKQTNIACHTKRKRKNVLTGGLSGNSGLPLCGV